MNSENFSFLREFARGYLHEDMVQEYGSVLDAAKMYSADLNSDERQQLASEARAFLAEARVWNTEELNEQLQKLGSAWLFDSTAEFEQVLRFFGRTQ